MSAANTILSESQRSRPPRSVRGGATANPGRDPIPPFPGSLRKAHPKEKEVNEGEDPLLPIPHSVTSNAGGGASIASLVCHCSALGMEGWESGLSGGSLLSCTLANARPAIPTLNPLNANGVTPPSYSGGATPPTDPNAQAKYSRLFTAQLTDVDVILPKKLCHAAGDKQFILYQNMATASIEHKFSIASHYVAGSEDAAEGDQTRPQFIQQ